jgi:pSer/pThr/pTyr-binding forkhead associated (FHA) protein
MKVITIGRTPDNDIVVNDVKVSRNHLQIVQDDYANCSVVDLGSTNGTFVNGQRITGEVRLQLNDVIQIGSTQLPWQNYLNPINSITQLYNKDNKSKPKNQRAIWYILATIIVVILLTSGVYLYVNHKNKKNLEKQEQMQTTKEDELKEQYQQKLLDAENYKKQAEYLYQQAIKTGDETYRKLAGEKQNLSEQATGEANNLNQKIEQLQDQLTNIRSEKELAEQKEKDAIKEKNKAIEAKEHAEMEKTSALSREELALNKAKMDSIARIKAEGSESEKVKTAEKNAKLKANQSKNFYNMINIFSDDDYTAICSELGYSTKNSKEVLEQKIIDADYAEIEQIISVVSKRYHIKKSQTQTKTDEK